MSYVFLGFECAFVISLDLELSFILLRKKIGEDYFIPKFTDKITKSSQNMTGVSRFILRNI